MNNLYIKSTRCILRLVVLQLEVFVLELHAVNRLAAGAVARREVTSLQHEPGNHPMELGPLVSELLPRSAAACFSRA